MYAAEYACHIFEKNESAADDVSYVEDAAEESHHEWKSDDYKGELLYVIAA